MHSDYYCSSKDLPLSLDRRWQVASVYLLFIFLILGKLFDLTKRYDWTFVLCGIFLLILKWIFNILIGKLFKIEIFFLKEFVCSSAVLCCSRFHGLMAEMDVQRLWPKAEIRTWSQRVFGWMERSKNWSTRRALRRTGNTNPSLSVELAPSYVFSISWIF